MLLHRHHVYQYIILTIFTLCIQKTISATQSFSEKLSIADWWNCVAIQNFYLNKKKKQLIVSQQKNFSDISDIHCITNAKSLEKVSLSNQSLPNVSFKHISFITKLSLINCKIKELNQFSDIYLPTLKKLILSYNNIENLTGNTLQLSNLVYLDLSHNNITQWGSDTFYWCNKLKDLDLSHNQLQTISQNTFRNTQALQYLDLSNNQIETIDQYAWGTNETAIIEIDLSHNKLSSFTANNLHKLCVLWISYNAFKTLHDKTFPAQFSSLIELDIQYNNIRHIDYEWALLKQLQFLNIPHNRFSYVDLLLFPNLFSRRYQSLRAVFVEPTAS